MLSKEGKAAARISIRSALGAATCLLTAGCQIDFENVGSPSRGPCGSGYSCVVLAVDPVTYDQSRLLKGDTLRFLAHSDSGYGSVTWSSDSGSIAFVTPAGLTNTVSSVSTSILVKGVGAGVGHVTATHTSPTRTASSSVRVVDSSSVALIGLGYSSSVTMRLQDSLWVPATLRDSTGTIVQGVPEIWETGDPNIAIVVVHPAPACSEYCFYRGPRSYVRAKAAGITTITAGFRGVRSSISVLITH